MFFISVGQPIVNADRSGVWIFVFILPSFFSLFLIFACSFVSPCFEFPKEEIKCLKDKTEKAMAIHSSSIAWKIPWTGEPGGLQSMGSLRVGHDWATSLDSLHSLHTLSLEKEMAVLLPGEFHGQRSLAMVHGVTESRTLLKCLSVHAYKDKTLPKLYTIFHEKKISIKTITLSVFKGIVNQCSELLKSPD